MQAGTHIGLGIVDNEGKILIKKEKDYAKKEKDMSNTVILTIKELINECLEDVDLKEIESIGMCFPGTVTDTVVVKAENLGIENLKIVEELKKDCMIY